MSNENYIGIKFEVECLGSLELSQESLHQKATLLLLEIRQLPRAAVLERAGNVSIRTEEGFIISGSGTDLLDLWYHHLVRVIVSSFEKLSSPIYYYGERQPSSETNLHWLIYKERPDVNAIVHLHPPNLSYLQTFSKFAQTTHFVPYGSLELAQMASEILKFTDIVLLTDHGTVTIGKRFEDAIKLTCDLIQTNI